jgi:hypothetical protein
VSGGRFRVTRPPRLSLRRADGQVSVLVAAFMALAMVLAAFGIDIAHVLVEKRHAQNAADASALAAGRFLPFDDAGPPCQAIPNCRDNIGATARDYSEYNGGPAGTGPAGEFEQCTGAIKTNCYDTPYKGHKYLVQIRIHEPVHLWFGGLPGLANWINGVNAKAVGAPGAVTSTTTTPGTTVDGTTIDGTTYAGTTVDGITTPGTTVAGSVSTSYSTTVSTVTIPGSGDSGVGFAKSTSCPAFSYTGAGGGTIGAFETNGGVRITAGTGTPKTVQSLGIGTPACDTESGPVTVVKKYTISQRDWPIQPPPVPTPPDCKSLGNTTPVSFSPSSGPPGVYCLGGTGSVLTVTGDLSGGYTFFAPCIIVAGNTTKIQNAASETDPPTALYASGTPSDCSGNPINPNNASILLAGNGNTVVGDLFAPNGGIAIQGGALQAGSGFMEAQTLTIQGNTGSYTGTGPALGGTTTTTTQTITTTTTIPGTTNSGSTTPGTTNSGSTTPGTTNSGSVTPGTTTVGSVTPGTTTTGSVQPPIVFPGTTTAGSTQTATTGTTVALNE